MGVRGWVSSIWCDLWCAPVGGSPAGDLVEDLRRALVRIAELERANAELVRVNAELSEGLARLERLVSRNSGNSSTPPSKDDDLGRRPPVGRAGPPAVTSRASGVSNAVHRGSTWRGSRWLTSTARPGRPGPAHVAGTW